MGRGEKNWRSNGRQFAHIMGEAYQGPLRLDLFQAAQVEPSKAHIVFHVPESGFRLDTALFSQGGALFGEQILPGLSTIFPKFEADLDLAIALGFGTLRLERAGGAVITCIVSAFRHIAIFAAVGAGLLIGQGVLGRTGKSIVICIVREILRSETECLNAFGFARWMGILIEGVVLEVILDLIGFEIGIILFAAIGRIA